MGGPSVVTYRYLSDKFLKPLHGNCEEGREKGARKCSIGGPPGIKQSRTASLSTSAAWPRISQLVTASKVPSPLKG